MKNIVIVDALSTGFNYVDDVVKRGYNPVIVESGMLTGSNDNAVAKELYKQMKVTPVIIRETISYEETLNEVKKYEPVLVLPGSESGVILANKLAYDLGLPCNDIRYLDAMVKKNAMHEALKEAGLRYIRGKVVSSAEEAVSYCKENGIDKAIVKPMQSAGSIGLFLCDDLTQLSESVTKLLSTKDFLGRPREQVLVQERIFGTEYIVNTISRNGEHRLNSMVRYEKVKTAAGHYVYDYAYYIDKMEPGYAEMAEYALKVADAIHYKNGPIHGEYMIDEKGPVLIEVNCRPMGGTQPGEYMDLITGQHETDSVLDALLDPVKFKADCEKPYRLRRNGVFKFVIVKEDIDAEDSPIWEIAKQLSSTYKISASEPEVQKYFPETIDLETNGGVIYMVNKDKKVLDEELDMIRKIEKRFFKLLLNDGTSRRIIAKDGMAEDPRDIIASCDCHGSILVATDEHREIEGCQCVTKDTLEEAQRGFDNVLIMYRNSLTELGESACLKLLFDTMERVREGGRVIIPKSTYDFISYGRQGTEELINVKGFIVELSKTGYIGKVVGTRERL